MTFSDTLAMPRVRRGGSPPSAKPYEAVGTRLKLLRLAFGKTQEELAKIVGVSIGMISRCESGSARLSADHMLILVAEYDVPMEWLYLGSTRWLSRELRHKLSQVSPDGISSPSTF